MKNIFQLLFLAVMLLGCGKQNTDDVSLKNGKIEKDSGEDFFELKIERLADGKVFTSKRTGSQESVFASFANQTDDTGQSFKHVHFSFPVGLKNFKVAVHGDQPGTYTVGEVKGQYKSHLFISQMLDGEFVSLEAKEVTVTLDKVKTKEALVTQASLGVTDGYADLIGSFSGIFTDGKQEYQVSGTFKTWNNLID